ncbi:hypothetical protein ARHIZOSPH14_24070 [Agromyces rhizosphaerae]|uniref:Uncharacterized protein n=1 Tax=Agromyces rhizosphaerae TaxID=88374 RepID=A0A9W6CXJ5_9MICO|nr:hypothetical protein ARHIZOSPH14_24070 [Agromyces rhizosphaerae]
MRESFAGKEKGHRLHDDALVLARMAQRAHAVLRTAVPQVELHAVIRGMDAAYVDHWHLPTSHSIRQGFRLTHAREAGAPRRADSASRHEVFTMRARARTAQPLMRTIE